MSEEHPTITGFRNLRNLLNDTQLLDKLESAVKNNAEVGVTLYLFSDGFAIQRLGQDWIEKQIDLRSAIDSLKKD